MTSLPSLVFLSRDSRDLPKHEFLRDSLLEAFPQMSVRVACGELEAKNWQPKSGVDYVFEGYASHQQMYAAATDDEIIALHAGQTEYAPSNVYRADRRFVFNLESERRLALEQAYLIDTAREYLGEAKPDFLFMMGGPNLIRSAFYMVAEKLGIQAYRILNATYLNPQREGVRYWLCSNNYCRISKDHDNSFGYAEADVASHVRQLLESITSRTYKLDGYARNVAAKNRVGGRAEGLLRRFNRAIGLKRPADGVKYSRIKSYKNRRLNRSLATQPQQLRRPYFLFPLNVPEDAQLVLRAPQFRDVLSACEQVANVLPFGHSLLIKEHPGHPGMLDHDRLKALLRYHRNVHFVSADVSLSDLLRDATALVTVNSTAGLEAIVNDIPVVSLGEAYYKGEGLTYDVDRPLDLQQALSDTLADVKRGGRAQRLEAVLGNLLRETVPAPGLIENTGEQNCLRVIGKGIANKVEQWLDRSNVSFVTCSAS